MLCYTSVLKFHKYLSVYSTDYNELIHPTYIHCFPAISRHCIEGVAVKSGPYMESLYSFVRGR